MASLIQVARETDAEEVFDLLQRAYAAVKEFDIRFTILQGTVEKVRAVIAKETVLLLRREGRAVATVTIRMPWEQDDNAPVHLPFIHWFAVDPDFKRQGYGTEILTWAEQHLLADTLKAPAVYLATAIRHPWLSNIYQKRGYQPFFWRTNPLGEEMVFLRKSLSVSAAIPERT